VSSPIAPAPRSIVVAIAAIMILCGGGGARAQDMEPRAYSAVPIDTNFLIGSYQRTTGAVRDQDQQPHHEGPIER
jgi:hypothetical protein